MAERTRNLAVEAYVRPLRRVVACLTPTMSRFSRSPFREVLTTWLPATLPIFQPNQYGVVAGSVFRYSTDGDHHVQQGHILGIRHSHGLGSLTHDTHRTIAGNFRA